jgi:uncharacterized membrane protein YdjX (TVP38/TMEM64 family)
LVFRGKLKLLAKNNLMLRDVPTLTEQAPTAKPLPTEQKLIPTPKPPSADPRPKQRLSTRQILSRVLALLIAGSITFGILLFAPQIQKFQQYGYPGVFLTSLIGNASIALPIPSLAITFTMAAILNWVIVGLVSGVGEALGETTGYLAGYAGAAIIENRGMYDRLKYWMDNHGMLTLFVLAVIPNPLFDLAGIAAGASSYGFHKFLLAVWMGKTIKTLIFAWAGAHSVIWLLQFL